MSNKRYINPSSNGYEKQLTYRELNKRRNLAQKNGNYVEMITFEYAMIEDRLLSILKHLNIVVVVKGKIKINSDLKASFYKIYYKNDEEHKDPRLYNITTKIKIIECIFKYNGDDLYFSNIAILMREINKNYDIKRIFKRLTDWLSKRNEIIHGMYNKDIKDFDKKINGIAIDGKDLSYAISSLCNNIKKNINE